MKLERYALQEPEKRNHAVDAVCRQSTHNDGHVAAPRRIRWTLCGQDVRRRFWGHALGIGHSAVDKGLKVLRASGDQPLTNMLRMACVCWR